MGVRVNRLASILTRSGGSAVPSILDQPLGMAGTGIYAGKTLVAGMDFATATAASVVATAASPKNPLWTSYVYNSTPAGAYTRNSNQAGLLLHQYDTDIGHTGYADLNGGAPMPFDNGAPQQVVPLTDSTGSGGTRNALRLHACRQSTAEQVLLNTGNSGQVERGAMAHTLASLWYCYPAAVRIRGNIPTGNPGWHPTFWSLQITGQGYCYSGSEHGYECNGSTYTSAYEDPHTGGSPGTNGGTVNIGSTYRDGAPHDWVWDGESTNVITYNVDGTQVNSLTSSKTLNAYPSYLLFTSHIVSAFQGENYSATAWGTSGAAGSNLDVFGYQIWVPTGGQLFKPLTTISDVLCTPGQTISVTLPSTLTLWGVSAASDQLICEAVEQEEPGNSASGWVGAAAAAAFPAWLSYNSGTRTLSGTVPAVGNGSVNVSGSLNMILGYCPAGNACSPATFRLVVAPAYIGATSAAFINGQAGSFNLYAAWDFGRDFVAGNANRTAAKALTASGLPTGMTLGTNGVISGMPTVNGSYTVTTTATNNDGQLSTANISITVQAAATAVAAPTGISSYALIGSWDPADASTVTQTTGTVTALAKSSLDSTSAPTLANASTGPTILSRTDGAGHTRNVLRFTSANSQYLQVFNNLGITAGCTLVVIGEHATVAANQVPLDITNGGGSISQNRHVLLSSTASGFSHRKCDASTTSAASVGSAFTTGLHLHVGRSPVAAATDAIYNLDGQGTSIVSGTPSGVPASLSYTTLGGSRVSGAQANYFDGWIYRVLVYAGPLTDAEVETIAVWANTNYGTANNA